MRCAICVNFFLITDENSIKDVCGCSASPLPCRGSLPFSNEWKVQECGPDKEAYKLLQG